LDRIASQLASLCHRHGLRVPDEISLAREVGLGDGSHLSVFFKAAIGEPPSSYRRRCAKPGPG